MEAASREKLHTEVIGTIGKRIGTIGKRISVPRRGALDATIPTLVVVYNRNGIPRLIALANIQEIEYRPGS